MKREKIDFASLKPSEHIDLSDSSDEDISSEPIAWRMPRRIFQREHKRVCIQSSSQNHQYQPKKQLPQQQPQPHPSQQQPIPVNPFVPTVNQAFQPQLNQQPQYCYTQQPQYAPCVNQMAMPQAMAMPQPMAMSQAFIVFPTHGNLLNGAQINQAYPLQGCSPSGPQFMQQPPPQSYDSSEEPHPFVNQPPPASNFSVRNGRRFPGNGKYAADKTKDQRYEKALPSGNSNFRNIGDRQQLSNHDAAFSTDLHSRNFNRDDKSRGSRPNPLQQGHTSNRNRPSSFNHVLPQFGNLPQTSRDAPSSTKTTQSPSMPGKNVPTTFTKKPAYLVSDRDPRLFKRNEESTKPPEVKTYSEHRRQVQMNGNDREENQTTASKRTLQHEYTADDSSAKRSKQDVNKKQSNDSPMTSPKSCDKEKHNDKGRDVTGSQEFASFAETISEIDKEKEFGASWKVTASETIAERYDHVPTNEDSTNDDLSADVNDNVSASEGNAETAPESIPDNSAQESAPGESQQVTNEEMISAENIKKESELDITESIKHHEFVHMPDKSADFTEITVKIEKEKVKMENCCSETESEADDDANTDCSSPENLANERLDDFNSEPHVKIKEEVNPEEEAKEDEADSKRRMLTVRPLSFLQGKITFEF